MFPSSDFQPYSVLRKRLKYERTTLTDQAPLIYDAETDSAISGSGGGGGGYPTDPTFNSVNVTTTLDAADITATQIGATVVDTATTNATTVNATTVNATTVHTIDLTSTGTIDADEITAGAASVGTLQVTGDTTVTVGPLYALNACWAGGLVIPSCALIGGSSTSKGFLMPKMTTTQRNAIASPIAGLMVYDTDLSAVYIYNGTWVPFGSDMTTGWFGGGSAPATVVLGGNSTSKGFLMPKMSTAQREAIVAPEIGLLVFDMDYNAVFIYIGSWVLYGSELATGWFGGGPKPGSVVLGANSTSQTFLPPVMSTTQMNAIGTPALGSIIYNSTADMLYQKKSTGWDTVSSTVIPALSNTSILALASPVVGQQVFSTNDRCIMTCASTSGTLRWDLNAVRKLHFIWSAASNGASNTLSGFAFNTWVQRRLNAQNSFYFPDTFALTGNGDMTFPQGEYHLRASTQFWAETGRQAVRFMNTTTGQSIAGSSMGYSTEIADQRLVEMDTEFFNYNASHVWQLQFYVEAGNNNTDACGVTGLTGSEIFFHAHVILTKLAIKSS